MRSGPALRTVRASVCFRLAMAAVVALGLVAVGAEHDDAATVEAASPDDVIAILVEGTGFGHGRGLSQWGAYGYAVDHGWTSDQILAHYYGGTNAGTVSANQRVRVRLTGYDGLGTVGVISHGSGVTWGGQTAPAMRAIETSPGVFRIEKANTEACPSSSSLSVPQFAVSFGSSNSGAVQQIQTFLDRFQDDSIVVDGLWGPQTRGVLAAWQAKEGLPVDGDNWTADDWARANQIIQASGSSVTWTLVGTHTQTSTTPVRFTTAGGDTWGTSRNDVLGVCSSAGRVTHYRGAIEVVNSANGNSNRVINDVRVEHYLRGVVPKEISPLWATHNDNAGAHAVRAQAVAARSYGLSENRTTSSYRSSSGNVQVATTCDTTSCQVYAGAATRSSAQGSPTAVEHELTDAAILATANMVRKWPGGAVVRTEFSASNGPRTAGGQFPPVNDIGDDTDRNPNHRWTRVLDADSFGVGTVTGAASVEPPVGDVDRTFDGIWFNDVRITGTAGTYSRSAWDFRNAFNLPSPGFTITPITRGSGGSVGLIGDSVGNSIAGHSTSEFRRLTDGTFAGLHVDVVDGRCTTKSACRGTSGVEAAAGLPLGLDVVVVELGYNDWPPDFAADVDAMMAALNARQAKQVVWVNMADIRTSGGSSYYGQANAALDAATARWPNLTVLDWDDASTGPERVRWFSDGVHLTSTGQAEFARWLRDRLLGVAPSHYVGPGEQIELPVVGESMTAADGSTVVVPSGVTAVSVNVTVVRPAANGHLAVWPCLPGLPEVSSLNYFAGDVRANSIIVPVSADGTICVHSIAGTHLIVDVAGWFGGAGDFVGLDPSRLVDTRRGLGAPQQRVGPNTPIRVPVHGLTVDTVGGAETTIGTDVVAAALNVTAVRPDARGHLQVWTCDGTRPRSSNVNFLGNQVIANGVIAPIGSSGDVCIYSHTPTDVLVDLMGLVRGGTDSSFRSAIPTRVTDTRESGQRLADGQTIEVPIVGQRLIDPAGSPDGLVVPATATAASVNVTMVNPDGRGHATVWPCTDPMPTASNVNYPAAGATVANGAVAAIGPAGSICVYAHRGADVLVDVAGWFEGDDYLPTVPERFVDTRYAIGPMPS